MPKILPLSLSLSLSLLTTTLIAGNKYNPKLQNGEFDTSLKGWCVKNNYFLDGNCYKSQNLDGESKICRSLRLESTDGKKWTSASQLIQVQPGAVYRVSMWAKIKDAGNSRCLFEFFKKSNNKSIRVGRPIYLFVHLKGTKDWFHRERYVQVPEGATFGKMSLGVRDGANRKSYAWFDAVEVEKSFNPPPMIKRDKWLTATKKKYGQEMHASAVDDKVVYYDPRHEFIWVTQPERIKDYLSSNGFKVLDADKLKVWMQKKIKTGADGSVCVISSGCAPDTIIETYKTPDVTLKKYLFAGGRIVWPGNIPLYSITSSTKNAEYWPINQRTVRSAILGFESGKYNQHDKVVITDDGKKWGIRARHEKAARMTKGAGITLSLSRGRQNKQSGSFFKNYNLKFPYSGFIRYRGDITSGSVNRQLQDIYRLALYRGTKIDAPTNFPRIVKAELSFDMPVTNFYQGTNIPVSLKCGKGVSSPITVTLMEKVHTLFRKKIKPKTQISTLLPTAKIKSGQYKLTAESGKEKSSITIKLLPVKSDKLPIVMYSAKGSTPYKQRLTASTIARNLGDCGYIANKAAETPMNNIAFSYGLKLLPRSYSHNYLIRKKLSGEREMRLKDNSIPQYHYGKRSSSPCFYNQTNRTEVVKHFVKELKFMKKYPGYKNRFLVYDDGAMFGEPGKKMIACYCQNCKAAFKVKTGQNAPAAPNPVLLKKGGIIPNSNVWYQWMRFRAKDVFGETFQDIYKKAIKKSSPTTKFCHILGCPNMTFDPQWALNPPDEFGNTSMIVYYYYPHVARPAYLHLPFAAKAVVGNRDKELWPTGQSTDYRGYINNPEKMSRMIRNQFYCMVAGGAKGTIWYDYNSLPGTKPWEEFGNLAEFANRFGPLVRNWRKSRGKVAILMSYANGSFKWAKSEFSKYSQNLDSFYMECLKHNIPVDFICDDEVKRGKLKQYKALILLDEDFMLKSVASGIGKYINNHGKVFISKTSGINLPGVKRGISLPELQKISDPAMILSGSDKVVWSKFTSGRGNYFLMVNTDLVNFAAVKAVIKKLPNGAMIANLNTCKSVKNGFTVSIAPGGAALIVVFPQIITNIKMDIPGIVSRGQGILVNAAICGPGHQVINAGIPVKIAIHAGNRIIFSDYGLAENGVYKMNYPVGSNTRFDNLRITVTELASGKSQQASVKIK